MTVGIPTSSVFGHLFYGVGQFHVAAAPHGGWHIFHTVGDQAVVDGTLIGWRSSYNRACKAATKARDLAVAEAKQQEAHKQLTECRAPWITEQQVSR